ncbi:sensor histidine kinase [Microbacterium rhizomatis]|uniref:Integral membrane sensor signal transduction histidine kinase n=1 Tax=Microbacterium rhizomatis TaxID=1631477 RepID=A0A5J5J5G1_9MICO|nr:ATP-binding protein [Microbacterium rhizomatis]KAA9111427.1 integral membrane sensor signal transduction histidine kinase [Microbacterium rhizomatis]
MTTDAHASAPTGHAVVGAGGVPWVTVAQGDAAVSPPEPLRPRRVVLRLSLALVAAVVVVAALGAIAAQLLAERQSVNDAASRADLLAEAIVQPALTDALADGDAAAVAAFDALVREQVLGQSVVRVKLWQPDGQVVYADEPQLIGRSFPLSADQRAALSAPQVRAEVSDLSSSENQFESGGRLLEVYRPVWAPDGRELLFEMYSPYAPVAERSAELWRGFAGITISSLLLLAALAAPIIWRLLRRTREDDRQRATLLQHAVDASDAERRRIAATLHDGPVQELVATTFAAESAAATAAASGDSAVADDVRAVAASVRGNIRVLRSLLVDIYPASLAAAGLPQALRDLADGARGREVVVQVELADDVRMLSDAEQRLVYRVAQECVRNAVAHAAPCRVTVRLAAEGDRVVLDVTDDGPGFAAETLQDRAPGHLGTQVLADLVREAGATLLLATQPGAGTRWRLVVSPTGAAASV